MKALTGKVREAFKKWFDEYSQKHHQKEWLDNDLYLDEVYLPDELMNALIIEWLDSVGIYVSVEPSIPIGWEKPDCFIFRVCTDTNRLKFPTRQQATERAIERAVELFNERSER